MLEDYIAELVFNNYYHQNFKIEDKTHYEREKEKFDREYKPHIVEALKIHEEFHVMKREDQKKPKRYALDFISNIIGRWGE